MIAERDAVTGAHVDVVVTATAVGSRDALAVAADELEAGTTENHVIPCARPRSGIDGRRVADNPLVSGPPSM